MAIWPDARPIAGGASPRRLRPGFQRALPPDELTPPPDSLSQPAPGAPETGLRDDLVTASSPVLS
ncbi:MAG TPA: hypothetical protein VFN75_03530 [Pseudonocardiaceae bacterium]|nr:hypothetical protein [Pseudonocardiaceae bacterium]